MKVCKYAGIVILIANVVTDLYQFTKDGDLVKCSVNIGILAVTTALGAFFGPIGLLAGSLTGTLIKRKILKWEWTFYLIYHPEISIIIF